jgi:hypothetical protein
VWGDVGQVTVLGVVVRWVHACEDIGKLEEGSLAWA